MHFNITTDFNTYSVYNNLLKSGNIKFLKAPNLITSASLIVNKNLMNSRKLKIHLNPDFNSECVSSVLRLKAEQAVNKDVDRVKAINNLGDELKTSKEDLSHRLKSLRKTLAEYEKREETSKQYKDIVSEYAKSKRLLNHKLQTLSLLNESNISFS